MDERGVQGKVKEVKLPVQVVDVEKLKLLRAEKLSTSIIIIIIMIIGQVYDLLNALPLQHLSMFYNVLSSGI